MGFDLEAKELIYLNQILAELHDDENCQRAFNVFLSKLKELVDFEKGDVYFYKKNENKIVFDDFIFIDWGEADLKSYIQNYCDIDDVLPILSNELPMMFRSSDVFILDERKKTKYYNELLHPAGMNHSIEGNLYVDEKGYIGGIGIHRPEKYHDFTEKDLEILKLCRPHLASVAKKYHRKQMEVNNYFYEFPLLSSVQGVGICIWDYKFKLLDYNLEQSQFVNSAHISQLMRALITMCKSIRENISDTVHDAEEKERMTARSRINIGETIYFAEVVLNAGTLPGDGTFIATVYDYAALFDRIVKELKERYTLTDREYAILQCVIKGMSNMEISKELFISVPTVKKHLGNIYNKMNIEGKHQILGTIL